MAIKYKVNKEENYTEEHHAARPMKTVTDEKGDIWLCDADVDETKDLKSQGCWRCAEVAFTRDD